MKTGKLRRIGDHVRAAIQEYVMELRKDLPAADSPEYKEKQQEFIERITAEYTSKPELWLTVYDDIRKTFLPVLQKQS